MFDPSPPTPEPPAVSKPRRSRWEIVLGLTSLVLLAGAITLVVLGHGASSDADAARAQASRLHAQAVAHAQAAHRDEQRAQRIAAATNAVTDDLQKVDDDMNATSDAHNKLVAIGDQSAVLYNQGSVSASQALMHTQGDPALADVGAKTAAAHQAVAALEQAIANLKEALDD